MTHWLQAVKCVLHWAEHIPPGLYHYLRNADGRTLRLHLRVDPSGDGLLLVNAAALARLNASGVMIAKSLLDGESEQTIIPRVQALFRRVSKTQIQADIGVMRDLIERLQRPADGYPIMNQADPAFSPKVVPPGRPISADVPLCPPSSMRRILERLWQQGIPHVTILAGRDANGSSLIDAVQRASDLGLITGVRGRGTDLATDNRVADLAAAGLDHLDILFLSADAVVHDSLAGRNDHYAALAALIAAKKSEICPVIHMPLVRSTLATMEDALTEAVRYDLCDIGTYAIATLEPLQGDDGPLSANELPQVAQRIEELADRLGIRLLWYPTMLFDPRKSLSEQVCDGPRCSGDMAVRIEPDGAVFLPRGPYNAAGNLLREDWTQIERSREFEYYRQRICSDTHCGTCPGLAVCAATCPKDPAGWAKGRTT